MHTLFVTASDGNWAGPVNEARSCHQGLIELINNVP